MEHVVFFPAHDGSPAFRRLSSLEEAVRLVEHLRNVEGVSEVSCHALSEVPLAFKAYYKVEIPGVAPQPEAAPQHALVAVPDQPTDQPAHEAPAVEVSSDEVAEVVAEEVAEVVAVVPDAAVPVLAGSNGHAPASTGPSSLGFFSR